jgi:hypothetical protein
MILKIFRVVWFFSVLAVLGFFMYTYASLPDPLVVMDDQEQVIISKEVWFYAILFIVAIFNMFVYVFRSLNKSRQASLRQSATQRQEGEAFVSWFYGLVICLNFFVIVAVSYVSLFNGGERFEYERIGFIIYGSIILMIAWAFAWPVYRLISAKGKVA